jgi:hypothetical protein
MSDMLKDDGTMKIVLAFVGSLVVVVEVSGVWSWPGLGWIVKAVWELFHG